MLFGRKGGKGRIVVVGGSQNFLSRSNANRRPQWAVKSIVVVQGGVPTDARDPYKILAVSTSTSGGGSFLSESRPSSSSSSGGGTTQKDVLLESSCKRIWEDSPQDIAHSSICVNAEWSVAILAQAVHGG